jgi:hypothetical protein
VPGDPCGFSGKIVADQDFRSGVWLLLTGLCFKAKLKNESPLKRGVFPSPFGLVALLEWLWLVGLTSRLCGLRVRKRVEIKDEMRANGNQNFQKS